MFLTRSYIILAIFIFIGCGIYLNALDNPFVYDDASTVVKNFNVWEIKNIPGFFINPYMSASDPQIAGHYRPLVVTSYAINYAVGGLNPVGYHLINIAFHAGSAFLIFLIVKAMLGSRSEVRIQNSESRSKKQEVRSQKTEEKSQKLEVRGEESKKSPLFPLTSNFYIALVAGLIFLVHPFNSEAVNYITARSSLMSGFFYLLGFYWWVRFRSQNSEFRSQKKSCFLPLTSYFYLGSLLAFVAGMLSKEVVITLPIVLWLYDMYGFNTVRSQESEVRSQKNLLPAACSKDRPEGLSLRLPATFLNWRTYISYLPFVLLVAVPYLLIRLFSLGKVLDRFQRDVITQLLTEIPVLVKHWQLFLIPRGLSLSHDVEVYSGLTLPVFLSGVLLALYVGIAIYLVRLKPSCWRVVSFFMFWFFIVLLPTTIIPLNAIFQENRGYLAMVSFAVLTGVLIREINRRSVRAVSIGLITVLMTANSVVTIQRNMVWGDEIRLWRDAIEKAPRSGVGYASLTAIYRDRGDLFRSIEMAKEGLSINPNNYYIRFNLGRTYLLTGEVEKAIQEYEKALRIDPRRSIVWNELALLYVKKGDLGRSESYLREAVRRWDNLPPLYYNLGVILAGQGKLAEAIDVLQKAINLYPEYLRARYELANMFERLDRFEDARNEYQEIIRLGSTELGHKAFMFGQDRVMVDRIVKEARHRLVPGSKS